jgi:hypothetical protein
MARVTVFRSLAYVSPLLVGFGVAAALAWTHDREPRRRLIWTGAVVGGALALLFLVSLFGGLGAFLPTALVLVAFAVLIAGTYLVPESLRLPPGVCQVAASLAAVFLVSTVFLLGPVVEHAEEAGLSGPAIYRRITLALSVNPFATLAYSVFGDEVLRGATLYHHVTRAADFQHGQPSWGWTALGYGLAGLLFGALAFGLREARRRWAAAP